MIMFRRFFFLLLLTWGTLPAASKASGKKSGSQKCEAGSFGSLVKDATVPLCDAHFPDQKAKSAWLILFYRVYNTAATVKDVMNRLAIDMGNEPPEKSKSLKKAPKKQKARIKDLAEKYEFEAFIPKKSIGEKEPLLKVGAVCCNCGKSSGEEQILCKNRESGLRLVRPKLKDIVMPGGDTEDAEKIMRWAMGELGFVKGVRPTTEDEAKERAKMPERDKIDMKAYKREKKDKEILEAELAEAVAAGDEMRADELQKKIKTVDATITLLSKEWVHQDPDKETSADPKTDEEYKAKVEEYLSQLREKKKTATLEEDYALAKKLKQDIEDIEDKVRAMELQSKKEKEEL